MTSTDMTTDETTATADAPRPVPMPGAPAMVSYPSLETLLYIDDLERASCYLTGFAVGVLIAYILFLKFR